MYCGLLATLFVFNFRYVVLEEIMIESVRDTQKHIGID